MSETVKVSESVGSYIGHVVGTVSFTDISQFINTSGYKGILTIQKITKQIYVYRVQQDDKVMAYRFTDSQDAADLVYTITFTNMLKDKIVNQSCDLILEAIKNNFKYISVRIPIDKYIKAFFVCENTRVYLGFNDKVQEIPLEHINRDRPLPQTNIGYYYIEARDITKPMYVYAVDITIEKTATIVSTMNYIIDIRDGAVHFTRS